MRILIGFLLTLTASAVLSESWVPVVDFQLENSNYKETLIWVSGVSYALSKNQEIALTSGQKTLLCNAPQSIGSRELLNYLNSAHKEQIISSEQAIQTVYSSLFRVYKCGKQ